MARCSSLSIPACLAALLLLTGCAAPGPGPGPGPAPYAGPEPTGVPADLHNRTAGFSAQLWAEKPLPRIGDFLSLKLRISADAYLSLYAIHTSGRTSQLLDNEAARSDRTLTFPGPRSPVDYRVSPPPGTETYLLVATEQPLRWLAPADIRRRGALTELNLTGGELQQRLRAVLERQNPYSWNGAVLNLPVDY